MAKKKEVFFSEDINDNELLKQTLIYLIDCVYEIRRDNFDYSMELKLNELQERLRKLE